MTLRRGVIFLMFFVVFTAASTGQSERWERLVKGQVVLHCVPEDLRLGDHVIGIVEDHLPRIIADFGQLVPQQFEIYIAPTEQAFHRLTGGQLPEWGVAAASPAQSTLFLKSSRFARPEIQLHQVVIHELSHIFLSRAMGGYEPERWFDEGLAQYEADEGGFGGSLRLARGMTSGQLVWLDEIDEVLAFKKDKAFLAYLEARSAIDFLVQTHGRGIIAEIISSLRTGKSMDEALLETTGTGFQDFQTDWYLDLKTKYRWAIFLDYPFLFSVLVAILFITAVIVRRKRTKCIVQSWEEQKSDEPKEKEEEKKEQED